MYKLFFSETFEKDYNKLDESIKIRVRKILTNLENNPNSGKHLYKSLREKKLDKFRIYYITYEQYILVFVIAISEKRNQQEVIDKIKKTNAIL